MCELNLVKKLNFWFGGHGSIRFRYNREKKSTMLGFRHGTITGFNV